MTSFSQQNADEKRMLAAGWRPAVFGQWTNGTETLPPAAILERLAQERTVAKAKSAEAKVRRAIWENVAGCACPSTSPKRDRCNVQAVRCNARLARIHRDMQAAGIKP